MYNSAANVNLTGEKLAIESVEKNSTSNDTLYGLHNGKKANISTTSTEISLTLAPQSNRTYSWSGIKNSGSMEIQSPTLNISTDVTGSEQLTGKLYGINNTGDLSINSTKTEVTLDIGSDVGFSTSYPQYTAIYSNAKDKGVFSATGEDLKITLMDNGKGVDNRIIQGIYIASGKANLSSNKLNIEGQTTGGYLYALVSQGGGTDVTLTSDTLINVKSTEQEGNSYGLFAMAGGKLTVDGNLEVHADKAIAIRGTKEQDKEGFSQIVINPNGDKQVKLYGDIDYNISSANKKSQNAENSEIIVNLTGENSVWEGHTTITVSKAVGEKAQDILNEAKDGLGITVNLRDGATWVPNNSSDGGTDSQHTIVLPLTSLTLDNGVIELTDKSGSEVKVAKLAGSGGEVHAQVTIDENSNITSNKLNIKETEGIPSLAVHAKGITADDVKDHQAAMESFYANALFLDEKATANTQLHIPEGDVAGKLTATVDSEDNVTVQENPHTISSSVLSIASSNYLFFRSQINDVASRLGDLRSMPKTVGAWVRYYSGQNKYSDRGMKEDYNTIQIGGDGFIADKYYLGGTFSYTDGNGTLVNGSSDDKNYNFGIYGGWLGDKGQFVDVIVKRHRIKSDFDLFNALGKSSGTYRTWGTSASIEAGWRLQCPANGFYAEPQAEFMLGHVESVNYRTNRGVRIHQDGINSAIGRVGVAFGYTFPQNKGNAYAKASVLHDWKGDVKASYSKDGVSRRMHDDLGGTWGEFAVGATYNPIKNLSAYGQFKTTTGSPIRTPWQASIGVRYSF